MQDPALRHPKPEPLPPPLEPRLQSLQQRVQSLQNMLTLYRWCLGAALLVIALLTVLLLFTKAPRYGRALIIDGKVAAMVRNEKAAAAVRQKLLAQCAPPEGREATFREKWEDAARPAEEGRVLTVNEAVALLKPRVTVLRSAYAIECNGAGLVVVPTREMAQRVLDKLKARYASPSDAVVRSTSLRPNPTVRACTALPAEVVSDESLAVSRLENARGAVIYYLIQPGDFPRRIATAHRMTLKEFRRLNPAVDWENLRVGDRVKVHQREGITVVTTKETVTTETIAPPVVREKSDSLPGGQKRILFLGKPGSKRVRWEIITHDQREVSRHVVAQENTLEPQPQRILIGTGPAAP